MGILTDIGTEYDDENEQIIITAVTRFSISTRGALNRVAGRASTGVGVGQRTLVASAYDDLGIDLVWNKGVGRVAPEREFPEAQEIEYSTFTMDKASEFGDIVDVPIDKIPVMGLRDHIGEGIRIYDDESQVHIWQIPYETAGYRA